jgi:hypothetical protein
MICFCEEDLRSWRVMVLKLARASYGPTLANRQALSQEFFQVLAAHPTGPQDRGYA